MYFITLYDYLPNYKDKILWGGDELEINLV